MAPNHIVPVNQSDEANIKVDSPTEDQIRFPHLQEIAQDINSHDPDKVASSLSLMRASALRFSNEISWLKIVPRLISLMRDRRHPANRARAVGVATDIIAGADEQVKPLLADIFRPTLLDLLRLKDNRVVYETVQGLASIATSGPQVCRKLVRQNVVHQLVQLLNRRVSERFAAAVFVCLYNICYYHGEPLPPNVVNSYLPVIHIVLSRIHSPLIFHACSLLSLIAGQKNGLASRQVASLIDSVCQLLEIVKSSTKSEVLATVLSTIASVAATNREIVAAFDYQAFVALKRLLTDSSLAGYVMWTLVTLTSALDRSLIQVMFDTDTVPKLVRLLRCDSVQTQMATALVIANVARQYPTHCIRIGLFRPLLQLLLSDRDVGALSLITVTILNSVMYVGKNTAVRDYPWKSCDSITPIECLEEMRHSQNRHVRNMAEEVARQYLYMKQRSAAGQA